jgi:hypothetical protein
MIPQRGHGRGPKAKYDWSKLKVLPYYFDVKIGSNGAYKVQNRVSCAAMRKGFRVITRQMKEIGVVRVWANTTNNIPPLLACPSQQG